MKLNYKLIRRRFPRLLSAKRVAVFAVLTCALAGAVAVARSSSDTSEVSGYVDGVEAQLAEWELTLDEMRRGDLQYDSIESYMLADDLELAMRDLRGDLTKLQTTKSSHLSKIKGEIDLKLDEVKRGIAQIVEPGLATSARTALNRE